MINYAILWNGLLLLSGFVKIEPATFLPVPILGTECVLEITITEQTN